MFIQIHPSARMKQDWLDGVNELSLRSTLRPYAPRAAPDEAARRFMGIVEYKLVHKHRAD